MSVSGFTRANCIVFKQSKRASKRLKELGVTVESYEHIKFTIDDCSRPEIRSMFIHSGLLYLLTIDDGIHNLLYCLY